MVYNEIQLNLLETIMDLLTKLEEPLIDVRSKDNSDISEVAEKLSDDLDDYKVSFGAKLREMKRLKNISESRNRYTCNKCTHVFYSLNFPDYCPSCKNIYGF